MPLTVKELITHLQTLPQDLPVYEYQCENDAYIPLTRTEGVHVTAVEVPPSLEPGYVGDEWCTPIYPDQPEQPDEAHTRQIVVV